MNRDKLVAKAVKEIEGAKNHFETLGVSQDATTDVIKRAFRGLCLLVHPDKNGNKQRTEEAFKKLNQANEVLKDEQERLTYILELRKTEKRYKPYDPRADDASSSRSSSSRSSSPYTPSYDSCPVFKCPRCYTHFTASEETNLRYERGEETVCCPCSNRLAKVQCRTCHKFQFVDSCHHAERRFYSCGCGGSFMFQRFPPSMPKKSQSQSSTPFKSSWRREDEERARQESAWRAQEEAIRRAEERRREEEHQQESLRYEERRREEKRRREEEHRREEERRRHEERRREEERIRQEKAYRDYLEAEKVRVTKLEEEQRAKARAAEEARVAEVKRVAELERLRRQEEQRLMQMRAEEEARRAAQMAQAQAAAAQAAAAQAAAQSQPKSVHKRKSDDTSSSRPKRYRVGPQTQLLPASPQQQLNPKRKLEETIQPCDPIPSAPAGRPVKKYVAKGRQPEEKMERPAKRAKIERPGN